VESAQVSNNISIRNLSAFFRFTTAFLIVFLVNKKNMILTNCDYELVRCKNSMVLPACW